MDKATVRQWKDRWETVAEFEAAERREHSVARRWLQLNAIREMSSRYGMAPADAGESEVWTRWAVLKGAGNP